MSTLDRRYHAFFRYEDLGDILRSRPPIRITRLLFVFLIGNLLPLGLIGLWADPQAGGGILTVLAILHPIILLATISWVERHRGGLQSLPLQRLPVAHVLYLLIIVPVIMRLITVAIAAIQAPFGLVAEQSNNPLLMDLGLTGIQQWVVGLGVVVLIPVAEEVLYRDLLYRALGGLGAWPSCILCSLLWAIMHGSIAFVLPLFFVGLLLSVLYESSGNLMAPIIAHVGFNLSSFILILLLPVI